MKKTITANISGSVFHIEEDAYEQLNAYLDSIRRKFHGSPDADEIIADIEGRIAELFLENKSSASEVITSVDVNMVIQTMGEPDDFIGDDSQQQSHSQEQSRSSYKKESGYRKLYRDPDDRWLGGVAGGIAAYFDTKVLTIRLLLLLSIFVFGVPILAYIIAWIVIPKAMTNAEKLEMRGEAVTVENIKRMFEDGVDAVEKGAKDFASKAENLGKEVRSGKPGNGVDRFFSFLGETLVYLIKALGKFIGFFFMLAGILLVVATLCGMFGTINLDWFGTSIMGGESFGEVTSLLFSSGSQARWLTLAGLAVILIPGIWLLSAGLSLIRRRRTNKWWNLALLPIWLIALAITITIGVQLGLDTESNGKVRTEIEIQQPDGELIYVSCSSDSRFEENMDHNGLQKLHIDGDMAYIADVHFNVEQSPDTLYHLISVQRAQGNSRKKARYRARNIISHVEQLGNELLFDTYFSIPISDKFRAQRQRFTLQVPVGKGVLLEGSSVDILDDVKNIENVWDDDMVSTTWTMTHDGLTNSVAPEDVENEMPMKDLGEGIHDELDEEHERYEEEMEEDEPHEVVLDISVVSNERPRVKEFNMPTLFGRIR